MYPIISVPETPQLYEQLGTKSKFWFINENEEKILFKQGRPGTGENWSEKAACEIANLLGIPHAHYELADWRGQKGVMTPSFVPKSGRLVHGNELLKTDTSKRYGTKHHLIRLVRTYMVHPAIKKIECHGELLSADKVFTGYLMLDALIGNSDRHEENWALTSSANGIELAPTFDHASSLGRNETDEKRKARLTTKDQGYTVEVYASKAVSTMYLSTNDVNPLTPLEAFRYFAKFEGAGAFWLDKLKYINEGDVNEILYNIPDTIISGYAREFAKRIILYNKKKLLEETNNL